MNGVRFVVRAFLGYIWKGYQVKRWTGVWSVLLRMAWLVRCCEFLGYLKRYRKGSARMCLFFARDRVFFFFCRVVRIVNELVEGRGFLGVRTGSYVLAAADVAAAARAAGMYCTVTTLVCAVCVCVCVFVLATFIVLDVQPRHAYGATGRTSQCLSTPFIMVEFFGGLALPLEIQRSCDLCGGRDSPPTTKKQTKARTSNSRASVFAVNVRPSSSALLHACIYAHWFVGEQKVDVMPSYKDQIPEDVFRVSLMIVPDVEDDAGSSFAFQEPDQVLTGQAATMQGGCFFFFSSCWFVYVVF